MGKSAVKFFAFTLTDKDGSPDLDLGCFKGVTKEIAQKRVEVHYKGMLQRLKTGKWRLVSDEVREDEFKSRQPGKHKRLKNTSGDMFGSAA